MHFRVHLTTCLRTTSICGINSFIGLFDSIFSQLTIIFTSSYFCLAFLQLNIVNILAIRFALDKQPLRPQHHQQQQWRTADNRIEFCNSSNSFVKWECKTVSPASANHIAWHIHMAIQLAEWMDDWLDSCLVGFHSLLSNGCWPTTTFRLNR